MIKTDHFHSWSFHSGYFRRLSACVFSNDVASFTDFPGFTNVCKYMQCISLIQAIFLIAEVDLDKKWLKSRRIILFQMTSTFMTSYNQHALDPALATTSLYQGRKYKYERRLEAWNKKKICWVQCKIYYISLRIAEK